MELMSQPFTGQLGDRLIELLNSPDFHTLNIVVAFAKNSGVLRVKKSLESFRERGGVINAYVGVDLGGTSYEALTVLRLHTNSLNVVHSEKGQTFHTKIYQFLGEDKEVIIVGSHNLTGGGLWTNFESSIIISTDSSSANKVQMSDYFKNLVLLKDLFMPIGEQEDIEQLLQSGYVFKEATEKMHRAINNKENRQNKPLFGNGIKVKLPRLSVTPKAGDVLTVPVEPTKIIPTTFSSDDLTIWFETRRMTGGSRNILDLSKTSLIEKGDPTGTNFDLGDPKIMRGAVEFFGLNPTDTHKNKDIIINFDGVDYKGNSILFPVGDKANGSWRLQLKGTDSSKRKITDAFRAKEEEYLVKKVITFTKVQSDYYFMSVFPESELMNFQTASYILARNGATKTAKQLGILKTT